LSAWASREYVEKGFPRSDQTSKATTAQEYTCVRAVDHLLDGVEADAYDLVLIVARLKLLSRPQKNAIDAIRDTGAHVHRNPVRLRQADLGRHVPSRARFARQLVDVCGLLAFLEGHGEAEV